jgi:DNA-binding response OmpR family regulator
MRSVLLIHDGDVVMNALGLVLREEGYEVAHSSSVAQMLGTSADMVLIDAHSEAFDRARAAVDLKLQMGVRVPLFLFSSADDASLKQRAEEMGADGYVCTEWGFKRLISVVRFAMRAPRDSLSPTTTPDIAFNSMNRIVVLDDHPGARERLLLELRNQGYVVRGCGDLPTFEKLLEQMTPDVIVADVVLPGVQGDEICRRLKTHMTGRMIPIVLMSGLSEDELRVRAKRAGADAYFHKQDGLPKLIQILEGLLSEIVF